MYKRQEHLNVVGRRLHIRRQFFRDQLHHVLVDHRHAVAFQKKEVPALVIQPDLFPPVNPVGVHHDVALSRLAKNLLQPYYGERLRNDQIVQHLSRANAGELVDVPHQNQSGARTDRFQQCMKQGNVYHGHFIHDDHVRFQRVVLVPLELSLIHI